MKKPLLVGLYADPYQKPWLAIFLKILPFLIFLSAYFIVAYFRHMENPGDKLFPYPSDMYDAMKALMVKNEFTGEYVFLNDTIISLKRLFAGVFWGTVVGLFWGLYMGAFPALYVAVGMFTVILSLVVIPIFQPIILYVVGFDDVGKITLISLGIVFFIARDMFLSSSTITERYKTKAFTFGLRHISTVHRMTLPLIIPRWITVVRIGLGTAWIFLIMSEFISSNSGLGRQVQNQMRDWNMAVIIPYGLWTTFLAYSMDQTLKVIGEKFFPYDPDEG